MPKFEKIQNDILESVKQNQLVSAGAGSGKTTVMIEKISNLILSKTVDVDNLLVVTFTVLASEEMKTRLINKMKQVLEEGDNQEEKQFILQTVEKIKTASIDTIDGFNSKTIKKYFYDLQISPNIQIVGDASKDFYLTLAMKKTMDYANKNNLGLDLLVDMFGGNKRNFEPVEQMILQIYNDVLNIEDYEKFLSDSLNEYNDSLKSEKIVNEHICMQAKDLKNYIIQEVCPVVNLDNKKLEIRVKDLSSFNDNISFKTNLNLLSGFKFDEFSKSELKDFPVLKELKNKEDKFLELKEFFEKNLINENYEEKNAKIHEILDIFLKILKIFIKNYNDIKQKNDLIDFNDLNRLMLKLLKNERIKTELNNKYKYIFVDEYQDVNPLQDALITSLAGQDSKLFVVGDVKQSIYGFRGASPDWFLEKYQTYKNDKEKGMSFDMNINFRSSPIVLNFINQVFNKLMTTESSNIDYKTDCEIEPKREDIVGPKVEIALINSQKEIEVAKGIYSVENHNFEMTKNAKYKEAIWVVDKITNLVGTSFYDAKLKQNRLMTYSDIAILSRSEKDENATILINLLKQHNIPVNITNKLEITNSSIKLVLSILKCVCGTADDVDYLAFFYNLTDLTMDEIVSMRDDSVGFKENLLSNLNNKKVKSGFEKMEKIRMFSYSSTNKQLVSFILNDLRLRYAILQMKAGEKQLEIIQEFLNKISSVENVLSLAEFVELVESNVNSNSDFDNFDGCESVTLQTIHKSKGLEYPVVILFNTSKDFLYLKDNDKISFNADLGLGLDYYDRTTRTKTTSLPKFAIRLKNLEKGFKEELRLLYVAMTRAKNQLIITGQYSQKEFETKQFGMNNFAGMILNCFVDQISGYENELTYCTISFVDDVEIEESKVQEQQKEIMFDCSDFAYQNEYKFNIPFKNTVTGLNSQKTEEQGFDLKSNFSQIVQYDAQEDRAKQGVHYHKALEMIDFSKEYEKNTDFEDVDYKKIELAHKIISPLTNQATTRKEADFEMYLPYNALMGGNVDDKVLVQGVVDLIIIHKDYIDIVDYKFSRLNIKLLKQKYFEQLELYKYAVEKAFGLPVKNCYIYSINTGELL